MTLFKILYPYFLLSKNFGKQAVIGGAGGGNGGDVGGGGNDGGGVLGAGGGSRNVGHPSEFRLAARRLHSLYRLRSIRFKAPCTACLPACLAW